MDKQELNKKLAEWAGFKTDGIVWHLPIVFGNYVPTRELPDFPHSLDACFKWLVPKALIVLAGIQRTQKAQEILFRFWLEERWKIDEPDVDALAFCLAILRLIEKGEPNHEKTNAISRHGTNRVKEG